MNTVTVNARRIDPGFGSGPRAHPTGAAPDLATDLERARKFAYLMDAQFSVAGVKFGLDAIVGMVPVVGDTLAAIASLYPIWVARRHDLGANVQLRMGVNVLMDYLPGMIPIVGDLFDVAFKANLKNLKLLERAVERRRGK
jgi:hypothetical protein